MDKNKIIQLISLFLLIALVILSVLNRYAVKPQVINQAVETYKFDNITIKQTTNFPKYSQKVARLKIAKVDWKIKDISNWFKGGSKEINNPIPGEYTILFGGGKTSKVIFSIVDDRRFLAYYTSKPEKPKLLKTKLSQNETDKIVEKWLEFRGAKPWDAEIKSFSYIYSKASEDKSDSYPIGYDIQYIHKFEGMPIMDNLIKVELIDNEVVSYYRKWYRLVGKIPEAKKIISPKKAIHLLGQSLAADSKYKDEIEIESVELVYYNPNLYHGENKEGDILYPAWELSSGSGNYIIDAYNGNIKQKI